jgi:hypothetical protein
LAIDASDVVKLGDQRINMLDESIGSDATLPL